MNLLAQEISLLHTLLAQLPSFIGGILIAYITTIALKRYEKRRDRNEQQGKLNVELQISRQNFSNDIESRKQDRLDRFIDEAVEEVKNLRTLKEKMTEERLALEHKNFLLEQEIKQERMFAVEKDEEMLLKDQQLTLKQATIERQQREISDLKKMNTRLIEEKAGL